MWGFTKNARQGRECQLDSPVALAGRPLFALVFLVVFISLVLFLASEVLK